MIVLLSEIKNYVVVLFLHKNDKTKSPSALFSLGQIKIILVKQGESPRPKTPLHF